MDVVVPQTRSMADLLEVLDVVVVDDPDTRGDFGGRSRGSRPAGQRVRPPSFPRWRAPGSSTGLRFGVPRMYVGSDADAGIGATGIGGPTGRGSSRDRRCWRCSTPRGATWDAVSR
jgi:amidase